jgi:hypothetical protein
MQPATKIESLSSHQSHGVAYLSQDYLPKRFISTSLMTVEQVMAKAGCICSPPTWSAASRAGL